MFIREGAYVDRSPDRKAKISTIKQNASQYMTGIRVIGTWVTFLCLGLTPSFTLLDLKLLYILRQLLCHMLKLGQAHRQGFTRC